MELLKVENLTIGYAADKVLAAGINLSLNKNELVGLVGQNGVGKSTLIRTICGLQPSMKGHIQLSGEPIRDLTPKSIAKKISVVLTGKPDSLNLSVLELIALGRHPYSGWLGSLKKEDKEKIEDAITQMEINYLAQKRLFELSDGQLQKVMIARALAQDTDLIILDEPTSHLDLRNKIEVLNLLKKISESGKGVLISTHEIQLSAQVCNQFWCMDFGKEILVGEPKKLIVSGELQNYLHVPKESLG
ncbi:iron complex transport system ATP-binding protein [Ekhidna lutea]|uniref:Iron complex transport system ATP-binding protein n=1 Tax=Ekhidna lutea TaxID=447679 RepID=A0A239KE76_EKHLU|nr:ABC transporter ATP-binding protein [Ekhidna lutea]SNT16028.1 iron complex transport system ATP-binding protein [Ekhidna lutea]